MEEIRELEGWSIRRLAARFELAGSTVGRWLHPVPGRRKPRSCPVSGDKILRKRIKNLCFQERYQQYGHRRIRALLKRIYQMKVSRKTVHRIMREEGWSRPKVWHRPFRPKRIEKMAPAKPNQAWQIDMTSFQLSNLVPLFLVVVIDCYTRQIVGWTLHRRCRTTEWISALRTGLESRGWTQKGDFPDLVLRSDNGAQPCSKRFVEYLGKVGIQGQYTGYDAPDDNAFVERVIRTIKEEEIWLNQYDTFQEAHEAVDSYVRFYNQERIHSALDYQTPDDFAAAQLTLAAA